MYLGISFVAEIYMKKTIVLTFLLVFAFAKISVAQITQSIKEAAGHYSVHPLNVTGEHSSERNAEIWWELHLAEERLYNYHTYRKSKEHEGENAQGKGNWSLEGSTSTFTSTEEDLNEEYNIHLNISKARFFTPFQPHKKT